VLGEVVDGPLEAVGQGDLRLPVEDLAGQGDIRLAYLGVVDRQRGDSN
jgi:hypothetical protein